MKIRRMIFGSEIEIALTEQELMEAYEEQKKELDYNEVKETLQTWVLGQILNSCKFPYPGHNYMLDEQIEEAENEIFENKDLLLAIYEKFQENRYTHGENDFNMENAAESVLEQWGKEHPDFLKQFKNIKAIAYEKYSESWIKEINCSKDIDEFLAREYQEQECMKELLSDAEYAAYLNDIGVALELQCFNDLYDEKKFTYLTNALGEYDGNVPPEAPYEWYGGLGASTSSLLYLVKYEDMVGVLALHEYDDCFCEDDFNGEREKMKAFVETKADEIAEKLKGYQVIKGIETGFDKCDEIGLFIPYPMDEKEVEKLLSSFDSMAYEGSKEFITQQGSKEKMVLYTESGSFDNIDEINNRIAEINKINGLNYEALARTRYQDVSGNQLLIEVQVPTGTGIKAGLKDIKLVAYECIGNGDFENCTRFNELLSKKFNGLRTIAAQMNEVLNEVLFHKEYADYSQLRFSLRNGIYDIMQDSLAQFNVGEYSADITIRDYDGVWCIDYDVYRMDDKIKNKVVEYLDGGKVCDVRNMPDEEKDFIYLIEKAVQNHLNSIVKGVSNEQKETNISLEGKLKDARVRADDKGNKGTYEKESVR